MSDIQQLNSKRWSRRLLYRLLLSCSPYGFSFSYYNVCSFVCFCMTFLSSWMLALHVFYAGIFTSISWSIGRKNPCWSGRPPFALHSATGSISLTKPDCRAAFVCCGSAPPPPNPPPFSTHHPRGNALFYYYVHYKQFTHHTRFPPPKVCIAVYDLIFWL